LENDWRDELIILQIACSIENSKIELYFDDIAGLVLKE
jgi:hypothetical protein